METVGVKEEVKSETSDSVNKNSDVTAIKTEFDPTSNVVEAEQVNKETVGVKEEVKSETSDSVNKKSGVAAIKTEFLLPYESRTLAVEFLSREDKEKIVETPIEETGEDGDDQGRKRSNKRKYEKGRLRGQNKKRPPPMKVDKNDQLCNSLVDVGSHEEPKECPNKECCFQHDVAAYLASKPPEISDMCYMYNTYGGCPRGLSCRFGSQHITSDYRNKVDVEKWTAQKDKNSVRHTLTKDLQIQLRKHKYPFDKSEKILENMNRIKQLKQAARANKAKIDRDSDAKEVEKTGDTVCGNGHTIGDLVDLSVTDEKRVGCITDEDVVSVRPAEKKKIDWKGKLYLSPLTTVGNLPFRRICKEFGADVTCGEMAMASQLLQGSQNEWALTKRHPSEDLFGIQLCGNNPYVMTRCAQMLQEQTSVDFLDINLGCPIELVYEQGGGSGLLRRARVLESIVTCMNSVMTVPLTVKTRTGVYKNDNIAHTLMPIYKSAGISLITLHGRSREQRYTKLADWDYVDQCAKLASPVPLFGNGDVLSYEEYEQRINSTSVSGVMIGRGALMKPWIFTEIKEKRHWDISSMERLEILQKYANYGLEHFGSDTQGVERTRRFMLEWLSFLHRYIPVGLLEKPPQRINERPPVYKGRNELETLLASPSCADWIKISEMLLGPVPEKFTFLPKHKAHSWK